MLYFATLPQLMYISGEVAVYTCYNGYEHSSGTLTVTCNENGEWTKATLVCDIIDCHMPSTIANAQVEMTY